MSRWEPDILDQWHEQREARRHTTLRALGVAGFLVACLARLGYVLAFGG